MLTKDITGFGKALTMACDGRCDKAWGMNTRPKMLFSEDPDDYCFKSDDALGTAPGDPGTYEGGHGKPSEVPLTDSGTMNKWCFRECERVVSVQRGGPVVLPDLKNPEPNMLKRRRLTVVEMQRLDLEWGAYK